MSEIESLLAVQRLDTSIDQMRFKHENLPERQQLVEIAGELTSLNKAFAKTDAEREELRKQQRSLETDATDLKTKANTLEAKLYDGSVTSPKEATALGEEITNLRARQSSVEDDSIELLVEIEPLDELLVEAEAARGSLEAGQSQQQESLEAATADLDQRIEQAETERVAAAANVDDELLELYRKMRITYGPDAVVEFDPAHHGGCPVAMPAVELDRWKHLPTGTLEPFLDCGRLVGKLI